MGRRSLGWASAALLAVAGGAAGGEADDPPGPGPVRVRVGFSVVDFARVNGREESFDVHGLLRLRWNDPRLALPSAERRGRPRQLNRETIWLPDLRAVNALESVRQFAEDDPIVDDEGNVSFRIELAGKFSAPMDLRRFPFDRQTLHVLLEPRADPREVVALEADPGRSVVMDEAFLSDWQIREGHARVIDGRFEPEPEVYTRYVFEAEIVRRETFYIWRVLFPMTVLVALSWSIFWFDVTQLQPQISTALGLLLSLVVFNFSADFGMPRSPYLTVLDRHAVIAFGFVASAAAAVPVLHRRLLRAGAEAAARWQWRLRHAFPSAYALALGIEVTWLRG